MKNGSKNMNILFSVDHCIAFLKGTFSQNKSVFQYSRSGSLQRTHWHTRIWMRGVCGTTPACANAATPLPLAASTPVTLSLSPTPSLTMVLRRTWRQFGRSKVSLLIINSYVLHLLLIAAHIIQHMRQTLVVYSINLLSSSTPGW